MPRLLALSICSLALATITSSCTYTPPSSHPSYHPSNYPSLPPHKPQRRASQPPQKPSLTKLKNGHYRVNKPWTVTLSKKTFHIQKGYTSNGITAPKYIKASLGDHVNAPETWAAVFHDWCFTQKGISRTQADDYFIELMRAYRISPYKIDMMATAARGYTIYKGGN